MKNIWKRGWTGLLAAVMAINMCIPVLAASHTISSVSIKIKTDDLEVGEYLPELTYGESSGDNDGGVYVYTTSSKYVIREVEWVSSESRNVKVGEQPKLKVWLTSDDDDYYFRGTYQSSNVSVSGGSFVEAKKDSGDLVVTIKLDPIKGTYDEPADAYWYETGLGKARWSRGDSSSGAYDVYLYRGNSVIKQVEGIEATSYNFYPYMTQKGTYSFKVRTVPKTAEEKKYGKKSDWTSSDEQYVAAEDVSDGSGQTNDSNGGSPASDSGSNSGGSQSEGYTGQVGWIKDGNGWYFKYPDGNYQKNGWLKWNDKWYFFDSNGYMLTGWQKSGDRWYYLNPDEGGPKGAMVTGWLTTGGVTYYLNPNVNGPEGAMVTGWLTATNGKKYYMGPSGAMVKGWYKIGEKYYYFDTNDGSMAVNTTISGFTIGEDGAWKR